VLDTLGVCGSLPQEFGGAPPFSPNLYQLSPSANHPLHHTFAGSNVFLRHLQASVPSKGLNITHRADKNEDRVLDTACGFEEGSAV
jgi:hypothetical protein